MGLQAKRGTKNISSKTFKYLKTVVKRNCIKSPRIIYHYQQPKISQQYAYKKIPDQSPGMTRYKILNKSVSGNCQMCTLARLPQTPNTFNNQITTAITTTAFKILLMVPCMGMYLLISQSTTPTAIRTRTIVMIGMVKV